MNDAMRAAQTKLAQLLAADQLTAGMYIRVRGDHLIAGRREPLGPAPTSDDDDRVRFTRLGTNCYGLSVKRHTGRWEKTPFRGTLGETVDAVCAVMQHLVATS